MADAPHSHFNGEMSKIIIFELCLISQTPCPLIWSIVQHSWYLLEMIFVVYGQFKVSLDHFTELPVIVLKIEQNVTLTYL